MKIKEITVSLRPEPEYMGGLRIHIEVRSDRKTVCSESAVFQEDHFSSAFDIMLNESKRLILKELQKSCPEAQPPCSCQEK